MPSHPKTTETYIINYECDSTACSGEEAWLRRTLFTHNIWDENFCNALGKTLIHIHESYLKSRWENEKS
jgi:hypothetical protein